MTTLILLALAVFPVLLLLVVVYFQDKYEKEPVGLLLLTLFLGMLTVLPAIGLEMLLGELAPESGITAGLYNGFVVAGFSEELCKLALLMLLIWRNRNFNEFFDGIVYAVYVSLGFALVENVMYVFGGESDGEAFMIAAMRAVLSVPGHFLFAVMMGYYFSLAKFVYHRRALYLILAFVVPFLLHGTYDSLLMIPDGMGEDWQWLYIPLFLIFVVFDVLMWKWGIRRIRHLQKLSKEQGEAARNAFQGFRWDF